ncbi:MAG: DNA topoisomerase IV subunit A, partial [Rhodocyclaceae bacterium]|nr:DNA topoisomerase IV subunit A [Rhodocyclaceae bacterium]
LVAESRSVWPLVVIDTNGRAYSVRVADLPGGRGDGVPITMLIDFQDGGRLAQALTDAPEAQYLFANSGGTGFIARVADLVSRQRAGKAFMSLEAGEKPLAPAKVGAGGTASLGDTVAAVSQSGRLLLFPLADVKTMAKGRGTILQALDARDEMVAVAVGSDSFVVTGVGRAGKPAEWKLSGKDAPTYRGQRARKGQPIPLKFKPHGIELI